MNVIDQTATKLRQFLLCVTFCFPRERQHFDIQARRVHAYCATIGGWHPRYVEVQLLSHDAIEQSKYLGVKNEVSKLTKNIPRIIHRLIHAFEVSFIEDFT